VFGIPTLKDLGYAFHTSVKKKLIFKNHERAKD